MKEPENRQNIEKTSPNSARGEVSYEASSEELALAIERAMRSLKRWRIEASSDGTIKAVRSTRILKFEDDVAVEVSGDGGLSRAVFESASRVGNYDLGQNRRNLRELLAAVDRELRRSA